MAYTLNKSEEKLTPSKKSKSKFSKKSKSKFQDDFSIDDNAVIACAPPVSNFEPMYFALDPQKRNFISCDNIKATALDPCSNSFEFEDLSFTSRIKKRGKYVDFSVKFPFKCIITVHEILGKMITKNEKFTR